MEVSVVTPTLSTMTRIELKKYRRKGAFSKASWKLIRLKEEGTHTGGEAVTSALVLKALRNIQKKGKNMISPATVRKR